MSGVGPDKAISRVACPVSLLAQRSSLSGLGWTDWLISSQSKSTHAVAAVF